MAEWMPTHAEVMAATILMLSEEPVRSDALFIHGSQGDRELDEREMSRAATLYCRKLFRKIVLNGLTAERCKKLNLAYSGYEVFHQGLRERGVWQGDIELLAPSNHTAAESENLLVLARNRGWERVTIMSYPHHQLCCFLSIVEAMRKLGIWIRVYNQSFRLEDSLWQKSMTKVVIAGGAAGGTPVEGDLRAHVAAEFARIVKYGQKSGDGFIPHATIEEAFAYIRGRDTRGREAT